MCIPKKASELETHKVVLKNVKLVFFFESKEPKNILYFKELR